MVKFIERVITRHWWQVPSHSPFTYRSAHTNFQSRHEKAREQDQLVVGLGQRRYLNDSNLRSVQAELESIALAATCSTLTRQHQQTKAIYALSRRTIFAATNLQETKSRLQNNTRRDRKIKRSEKITFNRGSPSPHSERVDLFSSLASVPAESESNGLLVPSPREQTAPKTQDHLSTPINHIDLEPSLALDYPSLPPSIRRAVSVPPASPLPLYRPPKFSAQRSAERCSSVTLPLLKKECLGIK